MLDLAHDITVQFLSSNTMQKKIRKMHTLIRKGAANIAGPWICLDCGVHGVPLRFKSYQTFCFHLVNVHNQKINPHIESVHPLIDPDKSTKPLAPPDTSIEPPGESFEPLSATSSIDSMNRQKKFKCGSCTKTFLNTSQLNYHIKTSHSATRSKCSDCGMTYSHFHKLKSHILKRYERGIVEADKIAHAN